MSAIQIASELAKSLGPLGIEASEVAEIVDAMERWPDRAIRMRWDVDVPSLGHETEPVAWNSRGRWWKAEQRPGSTASYAAGLYYIQDAASLLPITLLDVQPGEMVCDLCAAPGGKATAMAEATRDAGWLLANEPIRSRLDVLEYQLARTGSARYVVTNQDPESLAEKLEGQFDAVLVDAPCSGQTLLAKGKQSLSAFSVDQIEFNAARQRRILEAAQSLVRPGGRLVYSTCTLAHAENENQIEWFLKRFPDWRTGPTNEHLDSLGDTAVSIRSLFDARFPGCYRIWPHRTYVAEGHSSGGRCAGGFAAVLHKLGDASPLSPIGRHSNLGKNERLLLKELQDLTAAWGVLQTEDAKIGTNRAFSWPEILPEGWSEVVHSGPEWAYLKGKEWYPSHDLVFRTGTNWVPNQTLELSENQVTAFLRGETIRPVPLQGWAVATWKNHPLGWLKCVGGVGKNHLPKHART